jgi:hypothetical protein
MMVNAVTKSGTNTPSGTFSGSFRDDSLNARDWAAWLQDDWAVRDNLTVNLGVRYDNDLGGHGEQIVFEPWMSGERRHDLNNLAPRTGFAYSISDRMVMRGGYGVFFTQLEADAAHQSQLQIEHVSLTVPNDGRPDFAVNPFNGPAPTLEQMLTTACVVNGNRPGCLRRSVANEIPFGDHDTSFSHMASVGVQRQLGASMAIESNYVWTGGRREEFAPNINLITRTSAPTRRRRAAGFSTVGRRSTRTSRTSPASCNRGSGSRSEGDSGTGR